MGINEDDKKTRKITPTFFFDVDSSDHAIDVLYGGSGDDKLYGGGDNDYLYGGAHDDFGMQWRKAA